MNITWFQKKLLTWYDEFGRKDLPWKQPVDAYRIWVSEIMLQQTQVSTVIPYFIKFMKRFPNVGCLARAREDSVLSYWSGLGYYARARNLHQSAKIIMQDHRGEFPQSAEILNTLPGIGRSTAAAIAAQAFNVRAAILDGNVKRVLSRVFCYTEPKNDKKLIQLLWDWAEKLTPTQRVADYTQAIMDLGATLCTRKQPKCEYCPIQEKCLAYQNNCTHEIPTPIKKKPKPTRQKVFVALIKDNQIWIQKRPNHGIWGGLYSLPEFSDIHEAKQHLPIEQCATFAHQQKLSHSFTHFHMDFEVLFVRSQHKHFDQIPGQWVTEQRLTKLGLPAPIERVLSKVQWT